MDRLCGNCILRTPQTQMCQIFNEPMNANEPGCPKFMGEQIKCGLCGNVCLKTPEVVLLDPEDKDYLILCSNCVNQLGQCPTCAECRHCSFETDPINIPKQIQKQIRQGPMVIQSVVRNPEREKETCAKGCPCWDSVKNSCLRQNSLGCSAWKVMK